MLACVASVSNRVIVRKLEQERKKNGRGESVQVKQGLIQLKLH